MAGDGNKLIGPDGTPIGGQQGVIVVKVPVGRQPPMQLLAQISKVTHSAVFLMPTEMDIYFGKLGQEQLENMHKLLHTALQLPEDAK